MPRAPGSQAHSAIAAGGAAVPPLRAAPSRPPGARSRPVDRASRARFGRRAARDRTVRTEIAQRPPEADAPERASALPALVLDALEMGALALDRERRVVYANRRIEELLGVEPGALLSLPGNCVFPGADARWLKGAARESRDFRIEAGDRDLTLRGESVPMRGEDGEVGRAHV